MKQTILKLLLLLVILITAFNCQKDDDFEESNNFQTKNNVIAKRVTLNEIKKNSHLRQSLQKIENQFDYIKKNKINSKINSVDNAFTILTDEIILINTDSTEAYTFRIEIPTHPNSAFENFVIER